MSLRDLVSTRTESFSNKGGERGGDNMLLGIASLDLGQERSTAACNCRRANGEIAHMKSIQFRRRLCSLLEFIETFMNLFPIDTLKINSTRVDFTHNCSRCSMTLCQYQGPMIDLVLCGRHCVHKQTNCDRFVTFEE